MPDELAVGDGLVVRMVRVTELREQDINAQMMQPRHFERLTANVKNRGQIESLPYCSQPDGQGPISIVSGHHRARAARAAELEEIPVLIDLKPMDRSQVRAKQIAHNELHGNPVDEILAQMIAEIDNVDDLLASGLDTEHLPTLPDADTELHIPFADMDYRTVTIVFLPDQMTAFTELVRLIDPASELIGVAHADQFDAFSKAVRAYGRSASIKAVGSIVGALTELALREIERAKEDDGGGSEETGQG